jgi:hypothetical protein
VNEAIDLAVTSRGELKIRHLGHVFCSVHQRYHTCTGSTACNLGIVRTHVRNTVIGVNVKDRNATYGVFQWRSYAGAASQGFVSSPLVRLSTFIPATIVISKLDKGFLQRSKPSPMVSTNSDLDLLRAGIVQ